MPSQMCNQSSASLGRCRWCRILLSLLLQVVAIGPASVQGSTFNTLLRRRTTSGSEVQEEEDGSLKKTASWTKNESDEDETVDVIIGFKQAFAEENNKVIHTDGGNSVRSSALKSSSPDLWSVQEFQDKINQRASNKTGGDALKIQSYHSKFNCVGAQVKASELYNLQNDPDVEYVIPDEEFHADAEETSYSIPVVLGGDEHWIPPFEDSLGCDQPGAFKVGIVDSGLAVSHPDFAFCGVDGDTGAPISNHPKCIGRRFHTNAHEEEQWYNPMHSHGTMVAGIVAASNMNGEGTRGLIGDENLCLVVARVLNDFGGGAQISTVLDALRWVAAQGVRVVNFSMGIRNDVKPIKDAVKKMTNDGILFVASSGNSRNQGPNYPAQYREATSVAAVDRDGNWASYSTYNDRVDLSAPGSDVVSTEPRGGLATRSGTSMAAAHVSGSAALIWRQCPACDAEEVETCLLATAQPVNRCTSEQCGAGVVQANHAFECLQDLSCCN